MPPYYGGIPHGTPYLPTLVYYPPSRVHLTVSPLTAVHALPKVAERGTGASSGCYRTDR